MIFPLKKHFIIENNHRDLFLKEYSFHCEVPILHHPGAFGVVRKNHIHEGVDLYCNDGDSVFSMMNGVVLGVFKFTGEHVDKPWWNNTWSVLVEHGDFVLNYGEIMPSENVFAGKNVKQGDCLGSVKRVLKKDKGRPMSMLHLEMYEKGVSAPVSEWPIGSECPVGLLNPTNLLLRFCR